MIQIQIDGVERAVSNLNTKAELIHFGISQVINQVGDRTVTRLQKQFKDLTITGNFFPKNLEYWVSISQIGKTKTWIKCPTSNLFFTRDRKLDGSQDIKSNIPTVDIGKIVEEITNELSFKIKEMIGNVLK